MLAKVNKNTHRRLHFNCMHKKIAFARDNDSHCKKKREWALDRSPLELHLVSVLIVGLSYGAGNVLSYNRHMFQEFLAFRDSPIIPLRRSPSDSKTKCNFGIVTFFVAVHPCVCPISGASGQSERSALARRSRLILDHRETKCRPT